MTVIRVCSCRACSRAEHGRPFVGQCTAACDSAYLSSVAEQQHVLGNQWGMMNETGNYPGQTWLWLYTMWYQLPPYTGAPNADLLVVITILVLSAGLIMVPLIPGLRDVPRWIPIYRLIWRRHYQGPARS